MLEEQRVRVVGFVIPVFLAAICLGAILFCNVAASQPEFSIWADEEMERDWVSDIGAYQLFDVYVFLVPGSDGATAAEYRLSIPEDHMVVGNSKNNTFIDLYLGDPAGGEGVAVTFNSCQEDTVWLFKSTILPSTTDMALYTIEECHQNANPIVMNCDRDSIINASVYNTFQFNRYIYPDPYLDSVAAHSPISLKLGFTEHFVTDTWADPFWKDREFYTHFSMYNVDNPADSVVFTDYYKSYYGDSIIYLYMESPMEAGKTYYLEANHICLVICFPRCASSGMEFTYTGGFEEKPDLDVVDFNFSEVVPDSCAPMSFELVIKNNGAVVADSFDAMVSYKGSPEDSLKILYHETYASLEPDQQIEDIFTRAFPLSKDDGYHIELNIDTDDKVDEWIEFNNDYSGDVKVNNPYIVSIEDVPGDNGGRVYVEFWRSAYEVYRPVDYKFYRRGLVNNEWTCVGIVESDSLTPNVAGNYEALMPTEADSNAADGVVWSVFTVMAAGIPGGDPSCMSCADSGYSVANTEIATMLASFSTRVKDTGIEIIWELTEFTYYKYRILRSEGDGQFVKLSSGGEITNDNRFVYFDKTVESGKRYCYRVEYIGKDNISRFLFETEFVRASVPPMKLMQNYPNPFNPVTEIAYDLPEDSYVVLSIYDVSGKLVKQLVNRKEESGRHKVKWRGIDALGNKVVSGIYLYSLSAGRNSFSKKMVLLR